MHLLHRAAASRRPVRSAARLTRSLVLVLVVSACSDIASVPSTPTPTALKRVSTTTAQVLAGSNDEPILAGRVIVRFKEGADQNTVAAANNAALGEELALARVVVLDVPVGEEEATAANLRLDPNVEFAEPDYMLTVVPCEVGSCQETNDPFNSYRWDLHNLGDVRDPAGTFLQATGLFDADIDWMEMADALGSFTGAAKIGIVDTGIRDTHVDHVGRVIAAMNFAQGYDPTFIGDRIGHGTHVAGIAAANGNNGIGTAGIAYGPNIRLINAKACELYVFPGNIIRSSCPTSSVANAIVYAVDQGANVINLSLGGDPAAPAGAAVHQQALQYALAHNVLAFCASGNNNFPGISFPARFPECIAVGATNWSDQRASYSNYGAKLELSAPGGDSNPLGTPYSFILAPYLSSTNPASNGTYAWLAGTSMATPQVTGLAAVLFASGMTDAAAVRDRLFQTVDDIGAPGRDDFFGYGRINAYRALTLLDPNAPPIAITAATYAGVEGSAVNFAGSESNDPNGKPVQFEWDFGDGSVLDASPNPSHAYADNGTYTATLIVTDQSGLADTATATVTIANVAPAITAFTGSAATVVSGGSLTLTGTFSDAGVNDAPWAYSFAWGEPSPSAGSTPFQGTLSASHTYLRAGTYTTSFTVTDKDGGSATSDLAVTVLRLVVPAMIDWRRFDFGHHDVTGTFVVLSTATFDARSVKAASARIGTAGVAKDKKGKLQTKIKDENRDGRPDLLLEFSIKDLIKTGALTLHTRDLTLTADLNDGRQISATASLRPTFASH